MEEITENNNGDGYRKEIKIFSGLLFEIRQHRKEEDSAYRHISRFVNSAQKFIEIHFHSNPDHKGGVDIEKIITDDYQFKITVIRGETDYFTKIVSKGGSNCPVKIFKVISLDLWRRINIRNCFDFIFQFC
jgi:hypothetical protein